MSGNTPIDLPSLTDIGSPEQAQEALNKLHANPAFRDAYYQDPNHPQHGDIHRRVVELHRIINEDGGKDPRSRVQAITEDAMAGQQEQREQRQQEAQEIADRLFADGLLEEEEAMPDDLLPEELEIIKTRVFAIQENWVEVQRRIERDLVQLPKVDDAARRAFADFRAAVKPEVKERHALAALRYIQNAYRARIGLKPRQVQKDEKE